MTTLDTDIIIVGAGIVGLALGRAFAQAGQSVIILERNQWFGSETSSRNSEVLHAGMYYPEGSLKARLCVQGKRKAYAYCHERGIAARALGKLIVATTPSELPALEKLHVLGNANDVEGLTLIGPAEIKRYEPAITALAAMHSPSSGIVDSHSWMLAMLGDLEDAGGALVRETPFEGASKVPGGWSVLVGGTEPMAITTRVLISAAGLGAEHVARTIEGLDPANIPVMTYAKGSYFRYAAKAPFTHLIYPMPSPGGLGIHVTPDMDGRARFGPDVEPVTTLDYRVDPVRRASFAASIRSYWPDLDEEKLEVDYSGIRPKIPPAPASFADFRIDGPPEHGLDGLFCLFGIDSPGLTSSMALAEEVLARAKAAGLV